MRNLILITFVFMSFQALALEASKDYPVRKVSLIASDEGFYPETITAFEGETLQIFFTSTQGKKSCALIKGHRVFVTAKKGDLTVAEAFLGKSGEYKIYCPGQKYEGKLAVIRKRRRTIASEEKKEEGPWMPKDYSE